jgi:hypothetical protein
MRAATRTPTAAAHGKASATRTNASQGSAKKLRQASLALGAANQPANAAKSKAPLKEGAR